MGNYVPNALSLPCFFIGKVFRFRTADVPFACLTIERLMSPFHSLDGGIGILKIIK